MSRSDSTKKSVPGTVEETFRDFWDNRPVRPRYGGKIGGVSAAIGLRYGIDPVLVRVAFVIAALYGGAGIVLYLLGWLLLPKEGDPLSGPDGPRRTSHSTSGLLAVVLVLLLIPTAFWVLDFSGVLGLALGVGALYLLHRNYGHRSPPVVGEQPSTATSTGTEHTWIYPSGGPSDTSSEPTAPGSNETPREPPSWDPLGAAPFAWDLPEPTDEVKPEPAPRRRSITLITLALALVIAAAGLAVTLPLAVTAALVLGVLGAGMVAGAFLRGGRGLIGAAIPVAVAAMLLSAIGPLGPWRGVGDQRYSPTSIESVRPVYTASAGNIELDLDQLQFPPQGQPLHTSADIGLGRVSVQLPPNVDATVQCSAERGAVQCLQDERGGENVSTQVEDLGTDGPGGGRIVLDLKAGTGNVEVTRG